MEHNKPNWDKLQAISVLTSDSPKLGPALKKNPYIYVCVCVCVSQPVSIPLPPLHIYNINLLSKDLCNIIMGSGLIYRSVY